MAGEGSRDQAAATSEFSARRFTTDNLAEHERLPMWREVFGRAIVNVEIEPVTSEMFRAEATLRKMPGLGMVSFKGSAMRFNRTCAMAASGGDSIGLVFIRDTAAALTHRKSDISLEQGDACPLLTDEPGIVAGRSHLGLLFPRAPLTERVRNITDAAARRIPRQTNSLRLLMGYLSALPERLVLEPPQLRDTVINHIYDLAALAICPDVAIDGDASRATAAARLALAITYIERHFKAPDLTISSVARDQNISPRYLQRLLETTGSTFSERVQELRLQRAYSLLADVQTAAERISDLALSAGFSDIAHFNRSFRKRFGDAPSSVRAAARARTSSVDGPQVKSWRGRRS